MTVQDTDLLNRRCPRLGGPVSFRYCRESAEEGTPCWKIMECWWEIFDVLTYLKKNLSSDNFNNLMEKKPKPKMESLIELIQKAKKNVQSQKLNNFDSEA
jgi:hypothetical protein